eukprot:TRINITY_DN121149_c0_g1_i1.p1 TRINITY_DN121149_c0_g1~~TRINITY_DN121149_c0_g1_i1.p1  ORF type:complete len:506 (-),score=118.54 TRINITY_DN121149_c0_g1_i1:83-1600(-)
MEGLPDARLASLPCVLLGGILQYLQVAKKPLTAPCHKVSDGLAKRCAALELMVEMATVWLLPLCEAYPMLVSFLACSYFLKESKKSSWQLGEAVACLCALSAWALPFVDPYGGFFPAGAMDEELLLDTILSPRSTVFVVALLLGAAIVHWSNQSASVLGSVLAPAMNFGVSALFLKTTVHSIGLVLQHPGEPTFWAGGLTFAGMLYWLRSSAAPALRKAFETHDRLSILAMYGMTSSAAAAIAGGNIFHETSAWPVEKQMCSFAIGCLHCWGMASLSSREMMIKKTDGDNGSAGDIESSMVEKPSLSRGRMASSEAAALGVEMPTRGTTTAVKASVSAIGASAALAGDAGRQGGTPLLDFSIAPRTVDDDDEMEDQLLASALAPQRLASVLGEFPGANVVTAGPLGMGAAPVSPQFDADFEEIMRRFNQDDEKAVEAGDGQLANIVGLLPEESAGATSGICLPAASPSGPAAVVMDAQDMLDSCGGVDEEELLLQSITDLNLEDL